jgi:hypothetical protein
MFDNIILGLCRAVALPAVTIDGICFHGGMMLRNLRPQSALSLLSRPGYCFYGFRGLHGFMDKMDLSKNRKILLIRDPRDILTSYFFSMKYSHMIPPIGDTRSMILNQRQTATSLSIDDYVLSENVAYIRNSFLRYLRFDGPTKVFRYEDIVFDKRSWVGAINDWLALGASAETVAAIAARHDIFPERENPQAHIRQVTPGNYRKHLAPGTVEQIDAQYREVMEHFGYS